MSAARSRAATAEAALRRRGLGQRASAHVGSFPMCLGTTVNCGWSGGRMLNDIPYGVLEPHTFATLRHFSFFDLELNIRHSSTLL